MHVVDCLVEAHPTLALEMLRHDAHDRSEARLRQALVGTAPAFVGGARHVSVDPSQFRVFVADAVYAWAVAVKGVESLIPAE